MYRDKPTLISFSLDFGSNGQGSNPSGVMEDIFELNMVHDLEGSRPGVSKPSRGGPVRVQVFGMTFLSAI